MGNVQGYGPLFLSEQERDGTIKRTKVSKGSGEIHYHRWKQILKKQLMVTEEEFNSMI